MQPIALFRSPRWLILAGVVHAAAAFFFIRHGALNPDEGFYAAAARAVWQGEMPYRDFGYTQTPLLPYVNGALLALTGHGLFEQRTVNGLWTAAALALAAVWVARRAGVAAALVLALLFTLSAPWMYFMHLGKTYAFTGFLATVAAWVWLEWPAGLKKSALLGLLGVVGTGCRLPVAPFFGLLWLAAFADGWRPDRRSFGLATNQLLAFAATLLLPFYLAAPENSLFWVFEFHRISVPLKHWQLAWQEIATLAPALWVATAGVGVLLLLRRATLPRRAAVLAVAALGTLAANLLPSGVYEEYGVPLLLPLAMAVAAAWREARVPPRPVLAGLLAVHLLATPAILWRDFPNRRLSPSAWLTPNAPRLNPDLPAQLAGARQAVRALGPEHAPFVGSNLILALEANRPVPARLRMGPFSVTTTLPETIAARLHLATPAYLDALLPDPAIPVLAFFPHPQLNYGWTLPTYERLRPEISRRWLEVYRRDFSLAYQAGDFLVLARTPRSAEVTR